MNSYGKLPSTIPTEQSTFKTPTDFTDYIGLLYFTHSALSFNESCNRQNTHFYYRNRLNLSKNSSLCLPRQWSAHIADHLDVER
jgi:hypothetical protein